jgi:23S rRNA pseudouridine955/2504/2580 synthase
VTGEAEPLERLFLHAWRLQLTSPSSGELIRAEAPLPDELESVLEAMRDTGTAALSGPEGRR